MTDVIVKRTRKGDRITYIIGGGVFIVIFYDKQMMTLGSTLHVATFYRNEENANHRILSETYLNAIRAINAMDDDALPKVLDLLKLDMEGWNENKTKAKMRKHIKWIEVRLMSGQQLREAMDG